MSNIKIQRAIKIYNGFKGQKTVETVLAQVPEHLLDSLSGRQIGQVMSALNAAYHAGKASAGAELIDTNCAYINYANKIIEF